MDADHIAAAVLGAAAFLLGVRADYVLPMGVGSERHDTHSYETHMGQWLGFRQIYQDPDAWQEKEQLRQRKEGAPVTRFTARPGPGNEYGSHREGRE